MSPTALSKGSSFRIRSPKQAKASPSRKPCAENTTSRGAAAASNRSITSAASGSKSSLLLETPRMPANDSRLWRETNSAIFARSPRRSR